jgi:hypothetical protein
MMTRNIGKTLVAHRVGLEHALRRDELHAAREQVPGGLQLVAGTPSKKEGE